MSRRLAHRPHYHLARATPRPLPQSQQEYLRQRWVYRQQRSAYIKRPLGYGLSLVPWGWKLAFPEIRRRA
ncbi:MAG TPA: hypothetical protein VF458_09890 [Ktedonobacteraceae bacterium]